MKEITTSDGKVITLNKEQTEALALMAEWFYDRDSLFFTLAGYAGTGKTTIVKEFLDNTCGSIGIAVTAPTHKAKNVIAMTTGRQGSTLQSLMGIGIDTKLENYDPENPVFVEKRTPDFSRYHMVVVDESSMINKKLLIALLATARKFRVKVLFMGDKAQLPPVGEIVSDVFSAEDITYKYQLTKVERQTNGNPLMPLYDNVRNNLTSSKDTIGRTDNLNENGEGYRFVRLQQFSDEVAQRYSDPLFNPDSVKVLCWTNEEANYWNSFIREKRMKALYNGKPVGVVFPGDVLVATANRGEIKNSAEYLISACSLVSQKWVTGRENGKNVEVFIWVIRVVGTDTITKEEKVFNVLNSNDANQVAVWKKIYAYEHERSSRTKKWKTFLDFRDSILLIGSVRTLDDKVVGRDLDYGYALTVHKSQGSTYDEVFIHKDIWRNPVVVERNQLKYVAASRPRKTAHFLV